MLSVRIKCKCCSSPMIEVGVSDSLGRKKLNITCVNPNCQLCDQTFEAASYQERTVESLHPYATLPRRKYNLD